MWKIRTNQEWRGLHKDRDTVSNIKKKRLEWIGHVVGMDQGRTVKKMFEGKQEGSRRRGRSRMRWLVDVEKNVRGKKFKR
jgi:hypothetical protein